MPLNILEIKTELCPETRFIGKRYTGSPNWGEWWGNNWFSALEASPRLSFNGDAYIGAVRIVNDMPEYWIGMFFPIDTEVPEGFDYIDIPPLAYAVCYLQDKEGSGQFYHMETHNRCLDQINALGLQRKENDWCFERYNCPRFTTPDENGNVILDYGISIHSALGDD